MRRRSAANGIRGRPSWIPPSSGIDRGICARPSPLRACEWVHLILSLSISIALSLSLFLSVRRLFSLSRNFQGVFFFRIKKQKNSRFSDPHANIHFHFAAGALRRTTVNCTVLLYIYIQGEHFSSVLGGPLSVVISLAGLTCSAISYRRTASPEETS